MKLTTRGRYAVMAMVDLAEARRLEPLVQERLVQSGLPEVSTSPINHQLMP